MDTLQRIHNGNFYKEPVRKGTQKHAAWELFESLAELRVEKGGHNLTTPTELYDHMIKVLMSKGFGLKGEESLRIELQNLATKDFDASGDRLPICGSTESVSTFEEDSYLESSGIVKIDFLQKSIDLDLDTAIEEAAYEASQFEYFYFAIAQGPVSEERRANFLELCLELDVNEGDDIFFSNVENVVKYVAKDKSAAIITV